MACSIGLKDRMVANPALMEAIASGGTWTFTSTTNGSDDLTAIVDSNPVDTYVLGAIIGIDNPLVDFGPASPAEYVFTYTTGLGGSCQDEATLTVTVVDGVEAGVTGLSFTICQNDNLDFTLWNFITGGGQHGYGTGSGPGLINVTQPGGAITGIWSGPGVSNTGYDSGLTTVTDDSFNPNNAPLGPAQFTYTVDNTDAFDCPNCQDSVTITFIVSEAPYAGVDSLTTVCRNL